MRFELTADIDPVIVNALRNAAAELVVVPRPMKSILGLESGQVLNLLIQGFDNAFALHKNTPYDQFGFITVFPSSLCFPRLPPFPKARFNDTFHQYKNTTGSAG